MKVNLEKEVKKNKIMVFVGFIFIIISPLINNINLFYFPVNDLYLSFLGFIFFDGFEFSTISFFCGFFVVFYQLILIFFQKKITHDIIEEAEDKDVFLDLNTSGNEPSDFFEENKKIIVKSFEEVDELISQLDSVIKKSRHDVFNLMLDPNGINSPDDFQSAVESLELALSSLRSIHKQIVEIKKIV